MAAMVAVASVVVRMAPAVVASTVVSIDGGAEPSWLINGEPVARGSAAEGLLLNARLIQAIFDDSNATTRDHWAYPDTGVWDPDRNTDEFIGNLTTWRAAGLRAFTVGLQGGSPHCYGNPEDWTVSAFRSDGTLIPAWLTRLQRVLYAADKLGMVPIVQYFYYAQFSKIEPAAVPAAATAISQWLAAMPLRNFLVEVFNEKCSDKPVTPLGLTIANLIDIVHNASDASRRAKGVAPLLVSASCGGGGIPSPEVVAASDFVLLHGNGQTPEKVEEMVANVRAMPAFIADPKPIVFNEDDHGHLVGEDEDAEKSAVPRSNLAAAVGANASWGFLCCCDGAVQGDYSTGFQCPPVNWAAVGACLSGPHGNEMPQGSKQDFEKALQHYSRPKKTLVESATMPQKHALIPTPTALTFGPAAARVILRPGKSQIVYDSPTLSAAAEVLAEDMEALYGLALPTVEGRSARSSDILLALTPARPSPPPSPLPPPSPPPPPPPPVQCAPVLHNTVYNNTNYADGNGPRTAASAEECCNICDRTGNCEHWSFQIDPDVPGKVCHWATLTYCCWLHASGPSGAFNKLPSSQYTSGSTPPLPPPPPMPQTLPPVTPPGWPSSAYNISVDSTTGCVIRASTTAGILAGTTTLLQAASPQLSDEHPDHAVALPAMQVEDVPFREWRGLQLDLHGTPYHSIDLLKQHVRLARWYKLNVLVLHTGTSLWISSVMNSTSTMNATWRAGENGLEHICYDLCDFYTKEEIDELVQYASARGVFMVPHTGGLKWGATSELVTELNTSLLPPDLQSAPLDWMDEVDGKGASTYTGIEGDPGTERFWDWLTVVIERVYRQFAAGWPGGVLPAWHVGAVLGEGGMDGAYLHKVYDRIQLAAQAVHGRDAAPVVVGLYDGISATDPSIADIKENLAIHWYHGMFSASMLPEYVEQGFQVVDISTVPLYIVGDGKFSPREVFEYFNLFWYSKAGGTCWTPTANLTNNCVNYLEPGRSAQTLGGILTTWTVNRLPDELTLVRERAAATAEHIWNYRPFPYPPHGVGSWEDFEPKAKTLDGLLDKLIGHATLSYVCDESSLTCSPLPDGWTNGTDSDPECGGMCCGRVCPGPPQGIGYGGRLYATSRSYDPAMQVGSLVGIAAADAICQQEAIAAGVLASNASSLEVSRYRALLADEDGCAGKPCRRATVTPGVGDGPIDWVIAANAAYYLLDNTTLISWSNASRMLGVSNHTHLTPGNQISPFGAGWVTLPNRTCNSWRWSEGMAGGPFGMAVGDQRLLGKGFTAGAQGDRNVKCHSAPFICVEMAASAVLGAVLGSPSHDR